MAMLQLLCVSLCSHNNNTSIFNPKSNCHTCSQGYKYKLLMPYSQGVDCLYSPTISLSTVVLNIRDRQGKLWLPQFSHF